MSDSVLADDFTETARRIRAAMAYGEVSIAKAAKVMGTSPGDLSRLRGKKGSETKAATVKQLWALANAAKLPPEFFAADFARLGEIARAGEPVPAKPRSPAEIAAEEARHTRGRKPSSPPSAKRTGRSAPAA